jgi:hypothetical protein
VVLVGLYIFGDAKKFRLAVSLMEIAGVALRGDSVETTGVTNDFAITDSCIALGLVAEE